MSDCDESLMGDFEEESLGDLSDCAADDDDDAESRPSTEGSASQSPDMLTDSSATMRCGTPPRILDCGHSLNVISKFERVRVLGVRAAQLSRMAPSLLGEVAQSDPLEIAETEFEARLVPLTVQRRHPNDGTEIWPTRDMLWTEEMVEQAFDPDEWRRSLDTAPMQS